MKGLSWLLAILLTACAVATTPPPGTPGVIFHDDFSDPLSGWDRQAGGDITTDYRDGRYLIAVEPVGIEVWAQPGLDLADARVEVEAAHAGGPINNSFGLLCRYTREGDRNSFYFFLISSDGYYAVGKAVRDQRTFLNPARDFEPLAALAEDPLATHHLSATCQGDQLSFEVDGALVLRVQDAELRRGDLGLTAGTFDEGGVQIAFDNLVVRRP